MLLDDSHITSRLIFFPPKHNSGLKELEGREVCCYSISAKNNVNIEITLQWLIKHSKSASTASAV